MTKQEFLVMLKENAFPEPVLVEQPANGGMTLHVHDFEVQALVIEGVIHIDVDGVRSPYQVGDVFHLTYKQAHSENYGPDGVKYLASRKYS